MQALASVLLQDSLPEMQVDRGESEKMLDHPTGQRYKTLSSPSRLARVKTRSRAGHVATKVGGSPGPRAALDKARLKEMRG